MENQVALALSEQDAHAIQHYVSSASAGLIETATKQLVATKGYRTVILIDVLTRPEFLRNYTPIEKLIQIMDGRVSPANRARMKNRITKLYHNLLDEDFCTDYEIKPMYLLRQYLDDRSVGAVKILRPGDDDERQFAARLLQEAKDSKTESLEEISKAAAIAGLQEMQVVTEETVASQ